MAGRRPAAVSDVDKLVASQKSLAVIFAVDPATVSRWAQDGMPKRGWGKYPLAECVRWRIEQLIAQAAGDSSEITESRMRLYDTQREKHELEMKQMRRELLDAEEVATAIRSMFGIVATQLDGLGPRMAARLAGLSDPQKIAKELLSECRNIRRATADSIADFARDLDGSEDAPAPARKGRRRVGGREPGAAAGQPGAGALAD
jgi:phage terminase Nu1 subunit (DNA packaging protein)